MLPEPIAVTLQVTQILDELQIPYFVGGSLASAVHGILRSTLDADIVASIRPDNVEPLYQALKETFYIAIEAVNEAIERGTSFNLIHLKTMFKVDIFVAQQPYDLTQIERRTLQVLGEDMTTAKVYRAYVATAEDSILAKLRWYRLGGEVSERQWRDVLGVIKLQAASIDYGYLQFWAGQINVTDLLHRALVESGVSV